MLNRQPAVIVDIRSDDRIPQEAYAPTFVRSLAMMPIGVDRPVGAIDTYWSHPHQATADETAPLTQLARATAEAMHRLLPPACRP